jgi:hypothetical protein
MSSAFVSKDTGAAIYVFVNDHCPPHVHARHRAEGWIARVKFSYLNSALDLLSVAPENKAPLQRVVNRLLDNIRERLSDCRERWWMANRTVCLTNQWALMQSGGTVDLLVRRAAGAQQIVDAHYDPRGEQLVVAFRDGTTAEVILRP